MASVVAGGLFNAVAFAGASFMFSKFNHSGYTKEMHRHNLAMEQLTKAREKWNEERLGEASLSTIDRDGVCFNYRGVHNRCCLK